MPFCVASVLILVPNGSSFEQLGAMLPQIWPRGQVDGIELGDTFQANTLNQALQQCEDFAGGSKLVAFIHCDIPATPQLTRDNLACRIARGEYGPAAVISLLDPGTELPGMVGADGVSKITGELTHSEAIVGPLSIALRYLAV